MLTTGLMSEDSVVKVRALPFHSDTTASMLAFDDIIGRMANAKRSVSLPHSSTHSSSSSFWTFLVEHTSPQHFLIGMGLAGMAAAWLKASTLGFLGPYALWLGNGFMSLAILVSLCVSILYGFRLVQSFDAARSDWNSPLLSNFFPGLSIVVMLAGKWLASAATFQIGEAVWLFGALFHIALALAVMRHWIVQPGSLDHITPALFIPIVGLIVAPLSGAPFGYSALSHFTFWVALVFWLLLFGLVLNRLLFHTPLPQQALPSLFILMAPPALGYIAGCTLFGHETPFVHGLLDVALFVALLLATMAARFFRVPFNMGAWSYTFPSAALANAVLTNVAFDPHAHWLVVTTGYLLLGIATAILLVVITKTVVNWWPSTISDQL